MKILQFIESGGTGGAEQVLLKLSQGLIDRKHEVLVATTREGWLTENLDTLGIPRRLIPGGGSLRFTRSITTLLKSENIDLVHSHLLDSNFYCSLASWICRTPHIATEHGDVHHPKSNKFLRLKLGILHLSPTVLSAVSKYTQEAAKSLGVKNSIVIPNPIEVPDIKPSLNLRESLHIPENNWIWTHVANFRPVKDQVTLIKGFIKSLSHTPNQNLILIGDGKLRANLEELSSVARENIHFLGFRSDVNELLAQSDGFILSSLSEAFPMSILEAMMASLVIISSNVGGIPEVVRDGTTGRLFNPGDSEMLAQVLSEIIQNKEESRSLGMNAHNECLQKYSLQTVLDSYEALYKKLTN